MPSKSRDRHLAKNAERRRQERTRAKRSKQAALGVGGVIAAVLLILLGIGILTRNSDQQQAAATPSRLHAAGRLGAYADRHRLASGEPGGQGRLRRRGARRRLRAEAAVRSRSHAR